jgi:hypothetical protein
MSQQNTQPQNSTERERQIAEAQAKLLRLAEDQGVRPLKFDEMLDDFWTEDEAENSEDFDTWLRRVRND